MTEGPFFYRWEENLLFPPIVFLVRSGREIFLFIGSLRSTSDDNNDYDGLESIAGRGRISCDVEDKI